MIHYCTDIIFTGKRTQDDEFVKYRCIASISYGKPNSMFLHKHSGWFKNKNLDMLPAIIAHETTHLVLKKIGENPHMDSLIVKYRQVIRKQIPKNWRDFIL